jgi:ankyrin repeat protein
VLLQSDDQRGEYDLRHREHSNNYKLNEKELKSQKYVSNEQLDKEQNKQSSVGLTHAQ